MSEEKELLEQEFDEASELSGFVDFSDLGDFESISTMEMFGALGDIDDLGDMPELSDEIPNSNAEEDAGAALDGMDMPIPNMTEEVSDFDVSMPEMTEEVPDFDMSMPEVAEEVSDFEMPMSDATEAASDFDMPIPEMAEEVSDFDMSMSDVEEAAPDFDMPELDGGDLLSDLDSGISFDSVEPAADIPDIFEADSEPDLFTEGAAMPDMTDSIALEDTVEEPFSLDEAEASVMDASDILAEPVEDAATDDMNSDLLGGMDLGFSAGEEITEEVPLAMDEGNESGLDSMLGGILDNLDMNGSIDEPAITEDISLDDMGSMDDILGLDDNPFASEDFGDGLDGDMNDMLDVAGMIPEETEAEQEKPGFLKKVFGNVITDEIAEAERQAAQKAEEDAVKKAEEEAKAKEEAEIKKAEKKAAKEAQKAEKQKAKEAKKAEKAERKAEKKAQREEEEAAELEVVGQLNKAGVSIIVLATVLFLVVEIVGTNLFSYASTKKKAINYFEMGKYTEAYKEAIGTDMREKDEEAYNKIKVVMKVQQTLNAYQNYDRINYYPEALDSLLRGIKRYDSNIEQATELEVEKDMMSCRRQILTLLQEEFNLSESEAYALLALEKEAYHEQVIELGLKKKL